MAMIGVIGNECYLLFRDLKSILSGGAGKNGSTIAVSFYSQFYAQLYLFVIINQYTQGTSILSPIIPLMLVYSFTLIIYSKSMSNAFVNYVAIYIITFGFVCAKITCKLVVSEPKRKIYNLNFHVHFSFLSRLHI